MERSEIVAAKEFEVKQQDAQQDGNIAGLSEQDEPKTFCGVKSLLTGAAHGVEYAHLMGIDQLASTNNKLAGLHKTDVVGHGSELSVEFGFVFGLVCLEIGHDIIIEMQS